MTILGNRILIEPTEPIRQLPSGIYLPDTAVQKPNTGKVINVGNKANHELMGKVVMYNHIVSVNIEGKHLLHVTDIKMIL